MADLDDEIVVPVMFVQHCHLCGASTEIGKLDNPGEPWYAMVLWGYVALQDHLREMHPESGRG